MSTSSIRSSRLEVDLRALTANLRAVRAKVAPAGVYAVVKADAYGLGATPVARHLECAGVDGFCVALAEEGLALRAAGLAKPIIVLNGLYGYAHRETIGAGLTPVVYDPEDVRRFAAAARPGEPVGVHLKVDTGLGRLGVPAASLTEMLDALDGAPAVRLSGLMTHLSSAAEDSAATAAQLTAFRAAEAAVRARGHQPDVVHLANGAGALAHAEAQRSLVRVGLALYGVPPADGLNVSLAPVVRLVGEVARVATVPAGGSVGYGRTWRARHETRVATVALGYGDGVPWRLWPKGQVLVGGRRCPVVGRVSMDLLGVDVSGVPDVERGHEAVLFGGQGDERIAVEEVARWCGTLPYEVLTRLTARVPRVHRSADGNGNV